VSFAGDIPGVAFGAAGITLAGELDGVGVIVDGGGGVAIFCDGTASDNLALGGIAILPVVGDGGTDGFG